jgi:hypothetical protein
VQVHLLSLLVLRRLRHSVLRPPLRRLEDLEEAPALLVAVQQPPPLGDLVQEQAPEVLCPLALPAQLRHLLAFPRVDLVLEVPQHLLVCLVRWAHLLLLVPNQRQELPQALASVQVLDSLRARPHLERQVAWAQVQLARQGLQ